MDIDAAKYAAKKSIFLRLGLDAKSMSGDDITPVLLAKQKELNAIVDADNARKAKEEANNTPEPTVEEGANDTGSKEGDKPEETTETKPNQSENEQNSTATQETPTNVKDSSDDGTEDKEGDDPEKKKEDQE